MRDNIIIHVIIGLFYLTVFGIVNYLHGIEWTVVTGLAIIATNQTVGKDE